MNHNSGAHGSLTWRSFACTDVGAVRKINEDSMLARPERGLWAVADGMGGHSAGDRASQLVVARLDALVAAAKPAHLGHTVEVVAGRSASS